MTTKESTSKEKKLTNHPVLPESISVRKLTTLDNPIDVARYTGITNVVYPTWHRHRKPTQGELDHLHLFAIQQCLKRDIAVCE